MSSWAEIEAEAPELAERVRSRFEATGLAWLATLRRDGAPRISGVEPLIAAGELWIGMMPGSRKAADAERDPRVALHAATVDKEVTHGDAKVAGRLVPVTDDALVRTFLEAFAAATGHDLAEGSDEAPDMVLFRTDVDEVVLTKPDQERMVLVIDTWHEGRGTERRERT